MKLTGRYARNDKIHHTRKVPDTETCNTVKNFMGVWLDGDAARLQRVFMQVRILSLPEFRPTTELVREA